MADNLTAVLIPDVQSLAGAAVDPAPANTGNGTVTGIAAQIGSPPETWTLTTIITAVNGGTFSVIGSVSGPQANAVVGVLYNNGKISFTINDGAVDFVLGDNFTITTTAGFAASWTGNPNSQALRRSSKWSIYSAVAPGTVIEISDDEDGTTGWVASGIVTTAAVTHVSDPPVCKAVRLAGIAAAAAAPARFLVRHGWVA